MIAFISDVHSNLEALESVLKELERSDTKGVFFLGDVVGYGPDPDECTALVKQRCHASVAGNHDWAVIGLTPLDYFNEYARYAIEWTDERISQETREFLGSMPIVKILKQEDIFLVHSSPRMPDAWNYILSFEDAEKAFHYFDQRLCVVGHSHVPFIIEKLPTGSLVMHEGIAKLREGSRYIVNAGSVGQPRDGDPRAAYLLLDETYLEIRRVEYDYRTTQRKMKEAGLPDYLIKRLEYGR